MSRRLTTASVLAAFAAVAAIELWLGRLPLGPDGRFGWWESDIWSREQSQRFADPYSLTHVVHGLAFYAVLWRVARRAPAPSRFLAAVAIESAWEVLENSPLIIDRYRAVTISLGYVGDSVLNSLSDVLMMMLGYWFAASRGIAASIALAVGSEIGLAFWVRDNLALNLIMLIYPIDAIRAWQMAGAPH
jgi:hypothetical protein